jgi:hypothetical protein
MTYDEAISDLKARLARLNASSANRADRIGAEIRDAKENVCSRFAPVFAPENLDKLTAEDFRSFLMFKNNQHWEGLHRLGGKMTADMRRLRDALKVLTDEAIPIRTRLNRLRPASGEPMVKGLGRAVMTGLLQVLRPDKYGVLNNVSEAGMKQLELWPDVPSGTDFGQRYERVNETLLRVARSLDVDLWTLDVLWWRVVHVDSAPTMDDTTVTAPPEGVMPVNGAEGEPVFALERYLHEFLVDNWSTTVLGSEWNLLDEDGEIVGSHYHTGEVGEIDLLAKHRCDDRWLVVELKRNQTSDDTVGQVLRYMGWVRRKLADRAAQVEGLIICPDIDKKLQYAIDGQPNVRCMTYRISFSLEAAPGL